MSMKLVKVGLAVFTFNVFHFHNSAVINMQISFLNAGSNSEKHVYKDFDPTNLFTAPSITKVSIFFQLLKTQNELQIYLII